MLTAQEIRQVPLFAALDPKALEQLARTREHVCEHGLAADAIDERGRVVDRARPACRKRCGKRRGGLHLSCAFRPIARRRFCSEDLPIPSTESKPLIWLLTRELRKSG